MVFRYYEATDMLYIQFVDKVSVESKEVAPNIVLDFDENNQVVGMEIEDASKFIDLSRLELSAFPLANLIFTKQTTPVFA